MGPGDTDLIPALQPFFFFVFLGPHPQYMEVSRLGVKLELQPSLHHSHSNKGSEPSLRPTPQLRVMPDP